MVEKTWESVAALQRAISTGEQSDTTAESMGTSPAQQFTAFSDLWSKLKTSPDMLSTDEWANLYALAKLQLTKGVRPKSDNISGELAGFVANDVHILPVTARDAIAARSHMRRTRSGGSSEALYATSWSPPSGELDLEVDDAFQNHLRQQQQQQQQPTARSGSASLYNSRRSPHLHSSYRSPLSSQTMLSAHESPILMFSSGGGDVNAELLGERTSHGFFNTANLHLNLNNHSNIQSSGRTSASSSKMSPHNRSLSRSSPLTPNAARRASGAVPPTEKMFAVLKAREHHNEHGGVGFTPGLDEFVSFSGDAISMYGFSTPDTSNTPRGSSAPLTNLINVHSNNQNSSTTAHDSTNSSSRCSTSRAPSRGAFSSASKDDADVCEFVTGGRSNHIYSGEDGSGAVFKLHIPKVSRVRDLARGAGILQTNSQEMSKESADIDRDRQTSSAPLPDANCAISALGLAYNLKNSGLQKSSDAGEYPLADHLNSALNLQNDDTNNATEEFLHNDEKHISNTDLASQVQDAETVMSALSSASSMTSASQHFHSKSNYSSNVTSTSYKGRGVSIPMISPPNSEPGSPIGTSGMAGRTGISRVSRSAQQLASKSTAFDDVSVGSQSVSSSSRSNLSAKRKQNQQHDHHHQHQQLQLQHTHEKSNMKKSKR